MLYGLKSEYYSKIESLSDKYQEIC